MLYQLSYTPISKHVRKKDWWTVRDSNPGPTGYEPAALPTELAVRNEKESRHIELWRLTNLAPQVGLEPTTPRLTAACSTD